MNIEYLLDILKNRGYISIQDDRNLHGRASSDHLLSELRKNDKSGMELKKIWYVSSNRISRHLLDSK